MYQNLYHICLHMIGLNLKKEQLNNHNLCIYTHVYMYIHTRICANMIYITRLTLEEEHLKIRDFFT